MLLYDIIHPTQETVLGVETLKFTVSAGTKNTSNMLVGGLLNILNRHAIFRKL